MEFKCSHGHVCKKVEINKPRANAGASVTVECDVCETRQTRIISQGEATELLRELFLETEEGRKELRRIAKEIGITE